MSNNIGYHQHPNTKTAPEKHPYEIKAMNNGSKAWDAFLQAAQTSCVFIRQRKLKALTLLAGIKRGVGRSVI